MFVVINCDPDNDDTLRTKIEFATGTDCDFSSPGDPVLDETFDNINATYGHPDIDNNSEHQVGTSTSWIITSPGPNYVFFDWLSKDNLPDADGTYCIRLTTNDTLFDQDPPLDTQLLIIDNVPPSNPGTMSVVSKNYDNVILDLGSGSTDSRFKEYKIFYKEGVSGVTENDSEHNDSNLIYSDFNSATTTVVTGLSANTQYVFNIWAYDLRGNKASSTEILVKTNASPTNISTDGQYESDAITVINNGDWTKDNGVTFFASAHDQDSSDLVTFYYEVIGDGQPFESATTPPL